MANENKVIEYSENPSIRLLQGTVSDFKRQLDSVQCDLQQATEQVNKYEERNARLRTDIADYERTIRKLLAAEATK